MTSRYPFPFLARLALGAFILAFPATDKASAKTPLFSKKTLLSQEIFAKERPAKKSPVTIDADAFIYERKEETVVARGNVVIHYEDKTLKADRILYRLKTKRVFAEGNVTLDDSQKNLFFGDRFDVTDDFKNGYIEALKIKTAQNESFNAKRATRIDGDTVVMDDAEYTPCKICEKHPEKPPLWRIKARKVTHKKSEKTIYFEDARLEFWGLPIAYLPYFFVPDMTVKRKTGFLSPQSSYSSTLGLSVEIPFFWAIAPNMDVTFSPRYFQKQGLLGKMTFRHKFSENGEYKIRLSGINQKKTKELPPAPLGAGDKKWRGAIETVGRYAFHPQWTLGWQGVLTSDKYFLENYKIDPRALSFENDPLKLQSVANDQIISALFLNGQSDRAWFNIAGYHFSTEKSTDWQKQSPVVLPTIDYSRRFYGMPFGGEVEISMNTTRITRKAASFFPTTPTNTAAILSGFVNFGDKNDKIDYNLYRGCGRYVPKECALRYAAGTYVRSSVVASWRRRFIDDYGQVWTPFVKLRGDVARFSPNETRYASAPNDLSRYGNDKQRFFISSKNQTDAHLSSDVGVTYRLPLITRMYGVTHRLEPIIQLVAGTSERKNQIFPNEDSQGLNFDSSNLFESNRFPGFDRYEGGVRLNYGVNYSFNYKDMRANMMVGRSYHAAGRNSFAINNLGGSGFLGSGLEGKHSDFVSSLHFSPSRNFDLNVDSRVDESFALRSLNVGTTLSMDPITLHAEYAHVKPRPLEDYPFSREGLALGASLRLPQNWSLKGDVFFDIDGSDSAEKNLFVIPQDDSLFSRFRIISSELSLAYQDECIDFGLNVTRETKVGIGEKNTLGYSYGFRLVLKNFEELKKRI